VEQPRAPPTRSSIDEATPVRCLERALACRPGYDVAERNLQALDRS
jgi:hypothetical protein